jgi:hypothetical protein
MPATEEIVAVHAHICTACHAKGKNVVWVHGDDKAGNVEAHKCPACGTINWKKFLVQPATLPQGATPQQIQTDYNRIMLAVLLLAVLCLVGYFIYLHRDKIVPAVKK